MLFARDPHDAVARAVLGRAELAVDLGRALVHDRRDHAGDHRQVGDELRVGGRAMEAFGIFLGDEAGGDVAAAEARVLHQRGEEIDIVADAVDHELVERVDLRVDRRFARRRPGDQLGDHRVVEHADLAAVGDSVVDADAHVPLPFKGGGRGWVAHERARCPLGSSFSRIERPQSHPTPAPLP